MKPELNAGGNIFAEHQETAHHTPPSHSSKHALPTATMAYTAGKVPDDIPEDFEMPEGLSWLEKVSRWYFHGRMLKKDTATEMIMTAIDRARTGKKER